MIRTPRIVGIVNITKDSFSDGGQFLASDAAIAHAARLIADGADVIDVGAAASNPDAEQVSVEEEIRRLDPVITYLKKANVPISVDSFQPDTQRYAIARGVQLLNDIQGFPDATIYPDLAAAACKLVVMHGMQGRGRALRTDVAPNEVWEHLLRFFEERIAALAHAGVARERLVLDPGMGFFLSNKAEASLYVLARLGELTERFGLPLFVSVSRKSFLRAVAGRDLDRIGSATLAAEIVAALGGAAYIRTHDAAALADGLAVLAAVQGQRGRGEMNPRDRPD